MSLYKRGDSPNWWVKITIHGQKPVQRSTGTPDRLKAEEYHDQLKAQLWRQSRLGERPTYLWEDAVLRYLEETKHKRSHKDDKQRLRWLYPHLEGTPLTGISRDLLDGILEKGMKSEKRTAATTNRYTSTVRALMRKARDEWQWITDVPAYRMRKEPERRIRWITSDEADRLLAALPAHLSKAAEFALATGLRQANLFGLAWSQVDMQRKVAWIHADQAKAKRDISIPLNDDAITILRRQLGKCSTHVFSYNGRPMKRFDNKTWSQALKKAGIENFKWHDLRHTWASWHVQSGTTLQELMELGGWSCYKMVLAYAHLSSNHLTSAANNISKVRPPAKLEIVKGGRT